MDDAMKRQLKQKLLEDVEAWDQSTRGFQDIVRNAADIDKRILYGLMKAFQVTRDDVRGWSRGIGVPPDFQRYVIVEKIRDLLAADLGS